MPLWLTNLLPPVSLLLFVASVGACVGSFINVVVYRMPRGIALTTPPSRCPTCETRLTWRENIPVFGWLILGGRCRYCKCPISPEYPIVEATVALLFALLWVLYYMVSPDAGLAGLPIGAVRPEWTLNDLRSIAPAMTWPTMVIVLALAASLVAMTLTDAKTFTIPLWLAWAPTLLAVVTHTLHALALEATNGPIDHLAGYDTAAGAWRFANGRPWITAGGDLGPWLWTLPTGGAGNWSIVFASIGGVAGIGLSLVLVKFGLIRRSFADYDEWEAGVRAAQAADGPDGPLLAAEGSHPDMAGVGAREPHDGHDAATMWVQYPHARREMLKEIAFLGMPMLLGVGGALAARPVVEALAGPYVQVAQGEWLVMTPPVLVPLWLLALSGSVLGYLVGGLVVWAVRILGSLGFGKEALGLGDVHLMAAVGACLGWIDAIVVFFGAAFVGLVMRLVQVVFGSRLMGPLQYGPALAVTTLLVLVVKPLVEAGLSALMHARVDLP